MRFSDQIDTQTRTMHTEVDVPNPKYELVPGMYASVQIPLHAAANVLTRAGAGGADRRRRARARVLVVDSQQQDRAARRDAGPANRDRSRNHVRACRKTRWSFSASRVNTRPGEVGRTQARRAIRAWNRSSSCHHLPYDILI